MEVVRFLTTEEAARILRLAPQTLALFRSRGEGPKYAKLGRRIVYDEVDLLAWTEACKRLNAN